MTMIELLTAYRGAPANETLDAINEVMEYPRYSWVKSVLNDVPVKVFPVKQMGELLDEINKRERKAAFLFAMTSNKSA